MRRISVIVVVGLMILMGASHVLAKTLSAKDFAMKPTVGQVELGPQGKSLSFMSRSYDEICRNAQFERRPADDCKAEDRQLAATDRIIIIDIETMTQQKVINVPDDYTVNWTEWTSANNLLLSMTTLGRIVPTSRRATGSNIHSKGYIAPTGRILSIDVKETSKPVVLFGGERGLLRDNRNLAYVVDLLHDDLEHIIMGAWRNRDYDLFRVNVIDGSAERVAKGRSLTLAWYTDRDGAPAVRVDCASSRCRKLRAYRPADGADPNDEDTDWIRFRTIDLRRRGDGQEQVADVELIAPTGEPDEFYVEVEGDGHERRSIKVYNIRTDEFIRDVFSDPNHDVGFAVIDPETGDFAGAAVWRDRLEYHLEDERLQKHLDAINGFFDNRRNVTMTGFSNDGGLALVWANAPNDPGAYYLYDFEKAHVSLLLGSYDNMPMELDANTEIVGIPTRDDQAITGYHTVPGQSVLSEGNAPLIVLVHGGPEGRDYFNYDRDVQFLASRGFQILQVNFRGSSGYGRAFAEAGYGEWGGRMHDDIIDATQYLYDKGVASPETSCIMGHSYGGYAALYAGAVSGNQFTCVIAGAGPSDLIESLKQDKKEYGADSGTFEYWTKSMGDLKTQEAELKAVSPARLAEQFEDPVLLIHGNQDSIVQFNHSEDMFESLEKAGKEVTLLELNEGHHHNHWAIESSTQYFETLEKFLDKIFPKKDGKRGRSTAP